MPPFVEACLRQVALAAVLLAAWTAAAARLPDYLLPGPWTIARTLAGLAVAPATLTDVGATAFRVFSGVLLGGLAGALLGVVLGLRARLEALLWPWLATFGTVSSAVWAILALLWFGVSWFSTVFVVAVCVLPVLAAAVLQGVRAVDRSWLEMGQSLGLARLGIVGKVILPALVPAVMGGVRSAFSLAWRISVVAEAMGSTAGIGYRLRQAADMVRIDQVFAWALLLVGLTVVLELVLLRPVERHLTAWRLPAAR